MKFFLYFFVFYFFVNICSGQLVNSLNDDAAYIESLEKKAAGTASDSVRCYTYLKLSVLCMMINDTVKSKNYLQQGIELSKNQPFLEAVSWHYKALNLMRKGDNPGIEYNMRKADSLLQRFQHKEALKIRGVIWLNLSVIEQHKGNDKGAMDILLNKALPYAEQSGDAEVLGNANKSMGIALLNANQREKAAAYLQQAIINIEKTLSESPTRREALVHTCILSAENYVHLHIYDSAKLNLDKAKAILEPQPGSNLYLLYYAAEGAYYYEQKQYEKAISSVDKGLALGKNVPNSQFSVNRLRFIKYESLYQTKEYQRAISVLLEIINSPVIFDQAKKDYYKGLADSYAALGNKAEAYRWASKYITISDSLYEAKFETEIVELEKKYNEAENQKKISELQSEKEKAALSSKNDRLLIWLLGAAALFLLSLSVLGWLYFRNSKKLSAQKEQSYQQQLKEVKQEQQLQFTQALLQGEERERKRLAGDLHDGLGGMLAGVKFNLSCLSPDNKEEAFAKDLPVIINQLDKSVNELRRIARNMMPESLLNSGLEAALKDLCESPVPDNIKIDFQSFNIEKNIPADMQVTIYRIVQELLANAVRHAGASYVLVQCSQNENTFYITIEDNGKGFDAAKNGNGKGIGLINVKNRVDYLKGSLEINSASTEGTTINIEFNVNA